MIEDPHLFNNLEVNFKPKFARKICTLWSHILNFMVYRTGHQKIIDEKTWHGSIKNKSYLNGVTV
jgi:hypothetical protein